MTPRPPPAPRRRARGPAAPRIAVAVAVAVSLEAGVALSEKRQPMDVPASPGSAPSPSAALFDRIDPLANGRALKPDEVGQAFGLKLVPDKSASNPYFAMFVSTSAPAPAPGGNGDGGGASAAVTAVELRTPRKPEGGQGSLLILTVSPAIAIGQADVKKRYGDPLELSVPTPHQPPDAPVYWVYRRPWGKVSFGFSRKAPQRLVSVVIDATEK